MLCDRLLTRGQHQRRYASSSCYMAATGPTPRRSGVAIRQGVDGAPGPYLPHRTKTQCRKPHDLDIMFSHRSLFCLGGLILVCSFARFEFRLMLLHIRAHELPQNLCRWLVLHTTDGKKLLVQLRIEPDSQCRIFFHCMLSGYTTFKKLRPILLAAQWLTDR
jgi:hypothetical protein